MFQGHYTMFGVQYNTEDEIIQPLESQGIRRLYPSNGSNFDRKSELKKLNHSILANFLDLLEILIRCPGHSDKNRKLVRRSCYDFWSRFCKSAELSFNKYDFCVPLNVHKYVLKSEFFWNFFVV